MSSNFLNFYNPKSNSDRIYSKEDVNDMSIDKYSENKDAILYQGLKIGFPTNEMLNLSDDVVYVHPYTRMDGTNVAGHYRAKRQSKFQNWDEEVVAKPASKWANIPYLEEAKENNQFANTHSFINAVLNKKSPNAQLAFDMFLYGPEKLKLGSEARVITSEKDNDFPLVLYSKNSQLSKTIANDNSFKEKIKEMINMNIKNSSIKFNNRDLFLTINKADINDLKKENGYYTGVVKDFYDFEHLEYSDNYRISTFYNNYADNLQKKEKGHRFYIQVPFKIKISDLGL